MNATRIPVVVIGAGHAGLGVSRVLGERRIDHVVLERGAVANTWKTERWDSLRLLTPNRLTRLPGYGYDGEDPDGYMPVAELIGWIERYAAKTDAPVQTGVTVTSVRPSDRDGGYRVEAATPDGPAAWECRAVVLASGGFNAPSVPAAAEGLPTGVRQLTPHAYRNPGQVAPGRVLVVGASATGIQLADELLRSGREVTVAVGEHVRMPRRYRGHDAFHWLEALGRLDERFDQVDDLVRARRVPSPQLVGTPDGTTLDLNALTDRGAELVGRLATMRDGRALFSGGLHHVCELADLKQARLLAGADALIAAGERAGARDLDEAERPAPTRVPDEPRTSIDLLADGYDTVIWATGFRPDYSWLHVPVLDRKGEIRHEGGVVPTAPGLYRVGTNFLRRRKSSFIFGLEDDANDLVEHLVEHLAP